MTCDAAGCRAGLVIPGHPFITLLGLILMLIGICAFTGLLKTK